MTRKTLEGQSLEDILEDVKSLELDFKQMIIKIEEIQRGRNLSDVERQTIENIKKRLFNIQNQITSILNNSPSTSNPASTVSAIGSPIIIRCKHWEEFKQQASNAKSLSFLCKEEEKTFQVDAIRENRIYTYSGQMPEQKTMLKTWLSNELNVEIKDVLEGVLAIG
ncbi:MAG: hypothetical protein ACP5IM_01815 [Candidatus Bathyarchaeia archaeon]